MAQQTPSLIDELNETKFKLYIAIDFGTDGLGTYLCISVQNTLKTFCIV